MYHNSESFSVNTSEITRTYNVYRDGYGAIPSYPAGIKELISKVRDAAGWETGITHEGFRRGGFESRNIDMYGYDTERSLAVIQIRRAWRKKASWYTDISKVYALVGLDDGQVFSHPLLTSPRRNRYLGCLAPEEVVQWAESKIFGIPVAKLGTIVRQGDIALVPVRGISRDAIPSPRAVRREDGVYTLTMRDSHEVQVDGALLLHNRALYVDGVVEVVHTKHEHKSIAGTGKFKIVAGERAGSPEWLDATLGD